MNGEERDSGKPRGGRAALIILIAGAAIALATAGLIAAVVGGALNARQKAVARQDELRREGKAAALRLAAKGEDLIAEYLKRDQSKPWQPVKIDMAEIDPGGQLGATDGCILLGATLIGSSFPASVPEKLGGLPLPPDEPGVVKIFRGRCARATPSGLQMLEALQINVEFGIAGQPWRGSARLIVWLGK